MQGANDRIDGLMLGVGEDGHSALAFLSGRMFATPRGFGLRTADGWVPVAGLQPYLPDAPPWARWAVGEIARASPVRSSDRSSAFPGHCATVLYRRLF